MHIQDAIYLVVDTETTGLDPTKDRLVEIAAVAVSLAGGVLGMFATLVDPEIPIPPEVSAVHYLTNSDVAGAPPIDEAKARLGIFMENFRVAATVAHNAEFDAEFILEPPSEWICTRRLAQHLWPQSPTFKNQGLRFWRNLSVDTFGILPHRALGDALVTAELLRDLLRSWEFKERGIETLDDLRTLSNSPIRITSWPYGKHRGKPLDADLSYARWALGPTGMRDMDRDLRYSLNEVLKAV